MNNIKLYKIRDFSAKMTATVDYIRDHFKVLIKMVLLIVVPVALVFGVFMSTLFNTAFSFAESENPSDAEFFGFVGSMGVNYLLIVIFSAIAYALLFSVIYQFMKFKNNKAEHPDTNMIFSKAFEKLPGLVLLLIIIGVMVIVGMFLFVIPGIYLAVVLSLAIPIYLFEDEGVFDSLGKSFRLISGKWWSTFGLLVVTYILAAVISYIFAIPMYIMMIGGMFTELSDPAAAAESVSEMFSTWYTSLAMTIATMGGYITYVIPIIALGFQYGNLVERNEGSGIKSEIENFDQLD